ncbi:hypothetical protein C8A00DRAFT_41898 [Chaetomidium leptoderma]|uniref:Myb-like DNA-binding domain protein n=1 Tax=Chaetomidium leptoderma TaxID=669021 RepID=A0AAN6VSJ4_9PEZI|nr:hypothetical protein C8A00DRAFT_41898 [Chaetomidium leptoderma]
MERPPKRPRFGPAPFDDPDDPEADELNEQPQDVNARRDPAVQLERSRAFAAFKLKSAFERIFEKYERDFTGVGDEIDLRTGEIVVNNGHVQSLKDTQLGGDDEDGDGSAVGASEAASLNEEERMMRGKVDNRLSRVGHNAPPSIPMSPQIGTPFLAGGWPGSSPMLGGPPGLSSMMYPGQTSFGGFPIQYGTPIPMPTADPTWSTPELPSPFARNALISRDATPLVRKKAARLSLSAAREQDGGKEDDIFLDVSAAGKENGMIEGPVVKQKVLLPRPRPEDISTKKKKKKTAAGPKQVQGVREAGKHRKSEKSPAEEKISKTKPTAEPDCTLEVTSTEPGPGSVAQVGVPEETTKEGTQKDSPSLFEPVPRESRQSTPRGAGPALDREDPDVYVNISSGEEKLSKKPRNQTLRVELPTRKPLDACSFRLLTPEPSETGSISSSHESNLKEVPLGRDLIRQRGDKTQPSSGEVFSRNIVDVAYAFSDEDEPAFTKGRVPQRKSNTPKLARTNTTGHGVLREISQNLGSGAPSGGREPATPVPAQEVDESETVRAQSPTLSLHLDDIGDYHGGNLSKPPDETTPEPMTRRRSTLEVRLPLSTQLKSRAPTASTKPKTGTEAAEAVPPRMEMQRCPSKAPPQDTPTRTPRRLGIHKRYTLEQPNNQEVPETSPYVQPAVSSPPAADVPVQTLEIQDSDPPFSSEEQLLGISDHLDRAPSPTLTDPASRPQPTPPSRQPHTPTKPPNHHQRSKLPLSTTAAKTATTKKTTTPKRQGILSLLPRNSNNDGNEKEEEEEDELSIISPFRPSPNRVRSTPASHHVRLGLASASSKPIKAAAAGAAGFDHTTTSSSTPTGIGRKRGGRKKSAAAAAALGSGLLLLLPGTPVSSRKRGGMGLEESGELVQTPGGTMRRCGEGGFRCEREFCFGCL